MVVALGIRVAIESYTMYMHYPLHEVAYPRVLVIFKSFSVSRPPPCSTAD